MEVDFGLFFPPSFLCATPTYALEQAEIHYTHEADALRILARQRLLYNAAFGRGLSDFVDYDGHKCTSSGCTLISAPANEIVYECPFPEQHPEHKKAFDGSVLHRWSRIVFICTKYGVPHTCTPQMCSHQELFDGEMICSLTAMSLGPPVASVAESNYAFESGKAMTTVTLQFSDPDAINARTREYHESLPEHKTRTAQIDAAKVDAQKFCLSSKNLKRRVDDSGFSKHAEGSSTAGPVGLIDYKKVAQQRLRITSKPTEPRKLANPMVLPSSSSSSEGHHFSIACERPTEGDIRAEFSAKINRIWDLLEIAYSPFARRRELQQAEARVISRCIDKRKNGTNTTIVSIEEFGTIHAKETRVAFEGLEAVYIMSNWTPWTSGTIRQEQVGILINRMLKLWAQITRSKQFQQQPEPHLFQKIAGALIGIIINGYELAGCQVQRPSGKFYYTIRCSHRKTASAATTCEHKSVMLRLIEPSQKMQQLLFPPGMKRRSLDPVCGHILGQHNQIVSFLSSLVSNGLTPKQLREIYIGHT